MSQLSFDIFCKVVDNFGDIGVCWRLAKRLASMPDVKAVRLWVDDMHSFARIEPRVDAAMPTALLEEVAIVHWTPSAPDLVPHEIVIEAFACDPPPRYIERMIDRNGLWINLEYLSAEPWVESCHALPSLQANGLTKAFFFPGFTPATGGLLREPGLLPARDTWRGHPSQRIQLLRKTGMPEAHIKQLLDGAQQILLFSYPNAPAACLLDALKAKNEPAVIMVPVGVCPDLDRGQHGLVYVHELQFVNQADFDRLLWSSDLNCVRGEDSLVRALWAGRPLLWHIYPQDEQAHMAKLAAWLKRSPLPPVVIELMTAWNSGDRQACDTLLPRALAPAAWSEWQAAGAAWSEKLAQLPELADTLLDFCRRSQK